MKMEVDLGRGLVLKNPVMTASGTFGYAEEYAEFVDVNRIGAVVVKGVSLKPREGNPPPRIIETTGGMLNAIGLENVGIDRFIKDKLPFLRKFDTKVIVNIYGESIEEFRLLAQRLNTVDGIHALEVNISCPNVEKGGIAFGAERETASRITQAVRAATDLPVIIKLTPNVTDITEIASAAEDAGADALSLINTIKGMSVDIEKRKPHLKNVTGGLSGPAVRPVAVRMVWEVVRKVSVPVIGVGGIVAARDALEFLIVGARAVQVGTVNFINPAATLDVLKGLEDYLVRHGMSDINEVIGTLEYGENGNYC